MDIKKIKLPAEIYLESFDISVRPYLLVEDIMDITEMAVLSENRMVREGAIAIETLLRCTDIPEKYLKIPEEEEGKNEFIGFDAIFSSGLWAAVKKEIVNLDEVYLGYKEQLSLEGALSQFLRKDFPKLAEDFLEIIHKFEKKMPRGKQWTEMLDGTAENLSKVLGVMKEDGNAEIVKNAVKIASVKSDDD